MNAFHALGLFLWLCVGTPAPALGQPARIVVVDDRSYPPYAFLDASGSPRGITVEIWELWSRKTGVEVEFRLMDWEAALSAVREGRADAVGGMFKTPERERDYAFSRVVLKIPSTIFYNRSITGIKGLEDLRGFAVGVVQGDSGEELLRTTYPEIEQIHYPGTDDLIHAAIEGKINVFVADEPVARFYFSQHPEFDSFLAASRPIKHNLQYVAVRKGNDPLLSVIQAGFDRISDSEIESILSDWAGRSLWPRISWALLIYLLAGFGLLTGIVAAWTIQMKRRVIKATEQLRTSEARFRTLFENSGDAILILRSDLFVDGNPMALKLFGAERSQLIGHAPYEFSPPAQADGWDSMEKARWLLKEARDGRYKPFEWLHRRVDGGLFQAEVALSVVDYDGEPLIQATLRDITERKRAEERMRDDQRREQRQRNALAALALNPAIAFGDAPAAMRFLVETVSEATLVERAGIWMFSEKRDELRCVSLYERSVGRHSEGMVLPLADFPKYVEAIETEVRLVISDTSTDERTEEFRAGYFRLLGIRSMLDVGIVLEGTMAGILCIEHTGEPREWHPDEVAFAGTAAHIVALALSNARRRELKESLKESELRLRAIGNNLPKSMLYEVVASPETAPRFTYVSEGVRRLHRCTAEEALRDARKVYDDVHPEDLSRFLQEERRAMESEGIFDTVVRMRRPDGETGWSHLISQKRSLPGGDVVWDGIEIDITQQKIDEEKYRESQARFNSLFLVAPVGLCIVKNRVFTEVNDSMCRLTGYSREELTGMPALELYPHPEEYERVGRLHAEFDVKREISSEVTWKRKDGTPIRIILSGGWLSPEDPSRGVVASVLDITDKSRMEEELRISQQRLSSFMDSAFDSLLIVDSEFRVTEINPNACSLFGLPKEEILGRMLRDSLKGILDPERLIKYRKVLIDGLPITDEVMLSHPVSGPIWLQIKVFRVGEGLGVIASDITEKRRADDALRESEEWYKALVDMSPDAIVTYDLSGNLESVNRQAWRIVGVESTEGLLGKIRNIGEILDEQDRPKAFANFSRTLETGRSVNNEYTMRIPGRPDARIEVHSSVLHDGQGRPRSFISIVRDITDRVRAEEERRRLSVQLQHQQKLESIGTLAGGVAHEINNPIGVIINYAQLIAEESPPGSQNQQDARAIEQEGLRIAGIVKNLLAFSRQEKETHSPAKLSDILDHTMSLVRKILMKSDIAFEVDLPAGLPPIKCRSQQIMQVVMNLLTNARDSLNAAYPKSHPDKRLRITVSAFESEGRKWQRIEVRDWGAGVPDDLRERIFDPFFTTKPRDQGTGLGLSISHGLVKDHHGRLWFENAPDKGARFCVDLPVDNGWTHE